MPVEELFETLPSRYGQIRFFARDTGALGQSLREYGEWAENEISFMLNFVRPGDTVIDAGAYIGTHALAFAHRVGPVGQVISIEAQSSSFQLLQHNITQNGLHQVRLENAIASARLEEETIPEIDITLPDSFGSASLRDVMHSGISHPLVSEAKVKSITIDSLALERCALIKIDVEGMEDMVLAGAEQTLHRLRPVIYAECNSLEDGLRAWTLMRNAKYRVRAHVVSAYNADNFYRNPQNIFETAAEVALFATPAEEPDPLNGYTQRSCELLLDIETADDLALALLNKSQYESEVLRHGAAAKTGGIVCLDKATQLRLNYEDASNTIAALRKKVDALDAAVRDAEAAGCRLQQEIEAIHSGSLISVEEAKALLQVEKDRVDALQAAIDGIYHSTSWRVTAPLRKLVALLFRS